MNITADNDLIEFFFKKEAKSLQQQRLFFKKNLT